MIENTIKDWLAEFHEVDEGDFETFVSLTCNNKSVISAVFSVLEDRHKYSALIDAVCNALFGLYRSKRADLQRFALIFVPTLIYVYLNAVAHGDKKSCRGIEALLVAIYNLEVVDDSCQPNNISFRLPSLARSSIYHEPESLAPGSLTESALRRLEECEVKLVRWGPLPQVDRVIAQNRLTLLTALLFAFNKHLPSLRPEALHELCKVASKLVSQGFSRAGKRVSYSSDVTPVLPRIPVSQPFLLELLHSLYFSLFNGKDVMAAQAVEEVHQRACYQGYSDVIIVTNAIKSCTHHIHPGQGKDVTPMGINMAISAPPAPTTANISKSMITNASFRTKKLPEDIPIQLNKSEGDSSGLGSISEEKEDGPGGRAEGEVTGGPPAGPRRSLPKMAVNFGKKTRERLARVSQHKSKLVNGAPNDQSQEHSLDDDADSGLSEMTLHESTAAVASMQVSSV